MLVATPLTAVRSMLNRATVVPFARDVIDAARALAPEALVRRRFRVAGFGVDVVFGNAGLAQSYSARIGLPDDGADAAPAFRLFVLTAVDLGMACVPGWGDAKWSFASFTRGTSAAGISAEYPHIANVWRFFDHTSDRGVVLMNAASDLPVWHGGAPLVDLVRMALAERGLRIVHGATLGRDGSGILLLGDGGAGKSGTTLAGLRAGLQSVGDDYVAVNLNGGRPQALHLYRFMKQDRAGLARHAGHPVADVPGEPNWHGKIEFDPRTYFPDCLVESLALKACVIPAIAPDVHAPTVERVAAGEALRVAMRTNLFWGPIEEGMRFFADLLRLPCYRIKLAPDPLANGRALEQLVAEVA